MVDFIGSNDVSLDMQGEIEILLTWVNSLECISKKASHMTVEDVHDGVIIAEALSHMDKEIWDSNLIDY